uniref:Uncharacterized protein n=1 Tax=Anguilla anguilla TaxID=7936 RepID=A0A0E9RWS2_ANGAN
MRCGATVQPLPLSQKKSSACIHTSCLLVIDRNTHFHSISCKKSEPLHVFEPMCAIANENQWPGFSHQSFSGAQLNA